MKNKSVMVNLVAWKPERDERYTHEKDHSMSGNRVQARTRKSYAEEELNSSKKIRETGLVHRQPL